MANALIVSKSRLPTRCDSSRAAQYVRMSTDKQRYSIQNQAAVIAAYANAHGLHLIREYVDAGESGLGIKKRAGLQKLIADVTSGQANFSYVLVYDVSRWGRFQDTDESAHYEFICKQAGVKVAYCAEQFDNDGSMLSSIMKNLKRVMAAEYSRELGIKIHAGACRSVKLGFRHGGRPGYGLRRELIDENGRSKGLMKDGERKYLQTDRVRLRAGPLNELEVVRSIFSQFVLEKKSQASIARELNRNGIAYADGKRWGECTVHYILKNENYIGNLLYNRTSERLQRGRHRNSPDLWIRAEGAVEAVVEPTLFRQAQLRLQTLYQHLSDEEMLKRLMILLKRRGRLSAGIMIETRGISSPALYQLRFGSLRKAYRLIGFTPKRNYHDIDTRVQRRAMVGELASRIAKKFEAGDGASRFDNDTDTLLINGNFKVSLRIARCSRGKRAFLYWSIVRQVYLPAGWIFVARMTESNDAILDYVLLPAAEMPTKRLRISEHMLREGSYHLCHFKSFEAAMRSLAREANKFRRANRRKRPRGRSAAL